jgi:hypothetical protein
MKMKGTMSLSLRLPLLYARLLGAQGEGWGVPD